MNVLRFLVVAVVFFLCLLLGAGGGCAVGILGLGNLPGGDPAVGGVPVALLCILLGAAMGLILGVVVAMQAWRSFDRDRREP